MEFPITQHTNRDRVIKKVAYGVMDITINAGLVFPAKLSEIRRQVIERRQKTGENPEVLQWLRDSSNKDFYVFVQDCLRDQSAEGRPIAMPRLDDYVA
ncbi:hypothetical protein [Pseudomonas phage D6]|nr:hypothetical protein [Pseudomonas phage D6]